MDIEKLYTAWKSSTGVCTDTRKIAKGNFFVALKGPSFNGNTFAAKALEMGAAFVLVDEPEYQVNEQCLLVEDCLTALQQLAFYHRKQFSIPFLAITGSNGKTTTKELIAAVLSTKYKTYYTQGNLNNHIGIPLTLLSIKEDAEIAVIEMGANHQGEIASYCAYTDPTIGLITSIGKAHLEGFGGLEGVKKGKGELFAYLHQHKRPGFVNTADPNILEIERFSAPFTYPNIGNYVHIELLEASPVLIYKDSSGKAHTTQLAGAYNLTNIAAALCVGKYFKVDEAKAHAAIAAYTPDNMRSQWISRGSNQIILDAYNANPTSMKFALENLQQLSASTKVAVLGDMFELGDESEMEHRTLGKQLATLKLDHILLCGKQMRAANEECPSALWFASREELNQFLKNTRIEHATWLIKGSRGMGLEKIVDAIS
ncbi:MAG: UDP-N-acetylmuramoyl-tripeptide--D-alanyl-D-alanine ligase [Cytophagaceae bacterium]|jgi:UDP-N-acetylmuramoyl-tripeptide--D-alanyl-D-alanine ligase|nr:UDP-N-acetylmuramoyl-tripeptide--D-alanyl-D-alanine ligase [Cytophagaceae bacterium]